MVTAAVMAHSDGVRLRGCGKLIGGGGGGGGMRSRLKGSHMGDEGDSSRDSFLKGFGSFGL